MKKDNFKSSYTRKTKNVAIIYILKPKKQNTLKYILNMIRKGIFIYMLKSNDVPTGTVLPLTAYSVPHLNNMGKFNFIKYIRSNFDIGSLARITLVKIGKKNKHLMLTKIKEIKSLEYKHQKVTL